MKIISLFNHKGGVSKTTTAFNLGWSLADQGKKTLIVDADPQCNLTGTALGFRDPVDFENFYASNPRSNLFSCLDPAFQGAQTPLLPGIPTTTLNPNLFLLSGHIDIAELETQLAVSIRVGGALPAMRNLPGSITRLLQETGRSHAFDVIIVDMSPSVGGLNECILMGSDYFIVPTSPDYYCNQAIQSLARVLPRWNTEIMQFRDGGLLYPLPVNPPKFLGIISQRYRPRNGVPAASFQSWIDRIKNTVNTVLVPSLTNLDMVVSQQQFRNSVASDTPYNLENIADFNSLITLSQDHSTPVFALSETQLNKVGNVLDNMKVSRDNFRITFQNLARAVISLTGI